MPWETCGPTTIHPWLSRLRPERAKPFLSTNNDSLDSNGNLYLQGGTVRAFGSGSPECGIDANEEQGFSVIFTGGSLLAVGGGNSTPSSNTSTQPFVSGTASVSASQTITLKDGSDVLASFRVPAE